jgi:hypothetical protein
VANGSETKGYFHFIFKPWVLESVFFFAVMWQESFRLSARTSHRVLPVHIQIQQYYYYNFGDFVNGYIIAFLADGIIHLTLLKRKSSYTVAGIEITSRRNAFLSTIFSAIIISIFELMHSASTTSDINDIPAGILGGIFYYIIRMIALSRVSASNKPII